MPLSEILLERKELPDGTVAKDINDYVMNGIPVPAATPIPTGYELICNDSDGNMWVEQTAEHTPSGHAILEALSRHLPGSFIVSTIA